MVWMSLQPLSIPTNERVTFVGPRHLSKFFQAKSQKQPLNLHPCVKPLHSCEAGIVKKMLVILDKMGYKMNILINSQYTIISWYNVGSTLKIFECPSPPRTKIYLISWVFCGDVGKQLWLFLSLLAYSYCRIRTRIPTRTRIPVLSRNFTLVWIQTLIPWLKCME